MNPTPNSPHKHPPPPPVLSNETFTCVYSLIVCLINVGRANGVALASFSKIEAESEICSQDHKVYYYNE